MNILPQPNFFNRAISGGNYNYQIQEVQKDPKRSQLFKIDYVPTDKDRFFVRGKTWIAQQEGYAVAGGATPVGFFAQCYCFTEDGPGGRATRTSSARTSSWRSTPASATTTKPGIRTATTKSTRCCARQSATTSASGIRTRTSTASFRASRSAAFPSAPNVSYDNRLLTGGTDFTFNFNDNVTITKGTHNIKVGFDVYRIREYEGEQSIFSRDLRFRQEHAESARFQLRLLQCGAGRFQQLHGIQRRATAPTCGRAWWSGSRRIAGRSRRRFTLDYGVRWTWAGEMYPQQSRPAVGVHAQSVYTPGRRLRCTLRSRRTASGSRRIR